MFSRSFSLCRTLLVLSAVLCCKQLFILFFRQKQNLVSQYAASPFQKHFCIMFTYFKIESTQQRILPFCRQYTQYFIFLHFPVLQCFFRCLRAAASFHYI